MPYWDYKCPKCGHATESGKTEVICLMCTRTGWSVVMERQPSAPNFKLSGGTAGSKPRLPARAWRRTPARDAVLDIREEYEEYEEYEP